MEHVGLKILLVGKGAREHSLAWKLAQSPSVNHVYVIPGNGGTSALNNVSNIRSVEPNDYTALVALAKDLGIGLVVAGPDDAVVDGIEGYFRGSGIPCFAPSKEAAEIEGSKAYVKGFMQKHDIPTANYQAFTNYEDAQRYLETVNGARVVIKVDGLAAGKGVILPTSRAEAQQALREIMVDKKFRPARQSVVIEEYLEGDEISLLTFSDGKTFKSLPPAQHHKRISDGNKGLNTGGMGVYSPLPFVTPEQIREIECVIIQPTFDGFRPKADHLPTMMMLLAPECDLAGILLACCKGKLDTVSIPVLPRFGCNVVVAAGGYPESYSKGDIITMTLWPYGVQVFHAGTERDNNGQLKTAGGRAFAVAAYASSLEEAVSLAYKRVDSIQFKGMFYRKDIASRTDIFLFVSRPTSMPRSLAAPDYGGKSRTDSQTAELRSGLDMMILA
ncbi:hypothetical protein DL764_009279 [Monosporascus ibericus]|uniref:phosphoribosylamine--glycine ligase n=1 Tax=Monosporascus ibericus TaxID=155417 RepID=A0A4Q4SYA8_9PEZI|nr:hypothetical protein DL764_009279 [Monosporascus ibericus]